MPQFVIPENFFGVFGLRDAAQQTGANLIAKEDRARRIAQEDLGKLIQEGAVIRQTFGEDSPEYQEWSRRFMPNATSAPLIAPTTVVARAQTGALRKNPEERTTGENIIANQALYGTTKAPEQVTEENKLGLETARNTVEGQEQQLELGGIELGMKKREVEQADQYDTYLEARGLNPGMLRGRLDITSLEQANANVGLTRANTTAAYANAEQSRASAAQARAHTDLLRTQAAAAVAEAQNPFGRADAEWIAKISQDLRVPPSRVAAGLSGGLQGAAQQQFNSLYSSYVQRQQSAWQADIARAAAENNPAALQLQRINAARKAGANVNVTEQQEAELYAQVLNAIQPGSAFTRQEGMFFKDWVVDYDPARGQPGNNARTQTGMPINAVREQAMKLVRTHGAQAPAQLEAQRNVIVQQFGEDTYNQIRNEVQTRISRSTGRGARNEPTLTGTISKELSSVIPSDNIERLLTPENMGRVSAWMRATGRTVGDFVEEAREKGRARGAGPNFDYIGAVLGDRSRIQLHRNRSELSSQISTLESQIRPSNTTVQNQAITRRVDALRTRLNAVEDQLKKR